MSVMRRVFVTGKVQNVGYRAWAVRRAQALQLAGWVRNLKDGRVEILVAGDETAVEMLVEECRIGPEFAQIGTVIAESATDPLPKGFTKRLTA